MTEPLHLAASLLHLGTRELQSLQRVEVVAFCRDEVEVVGHCVQGDDGRFRATVSPQAGRHRALALRLCFAGERSRLSPAASLCACRCSGCAVVVYDGWGAGTRWDFGPDDEGAPGREAALAAWWEAEAATSRVAAAPAAALPVLPAPAPTSAATRAQVLASLRPIASVARLLAPGA